ncbi:CheY chemotaxis protein or a CheY-like REC (receiver) domain [Marivirga sericea]|uniref:CheY chemotaxis protein or a CheY-like REC (Receiver) domain n=1 Tax=Marivirga sericea TaxID=1028 RepID=A0A1X7IYZ1_9BACT|nr:response regulator [Marivirga sericea]SMG20081.1 CheY chemotaxis protein or a CheY-like REC (receiver) domain [Marivirga sericea]
MNIKTLVIDDDEISVMLTDLMIRDSPLASEIITFSDGVYAIEYLKNKYNVDTQYVIILDINMPLMNGWEFLERIKSFVSTKNTYVFMLSSSSDEADIKKSSKFRLVEGYFMKPLQKEHLKQIAAIVKS